MVTGFGICLALSMFVAIYVAQKNYSNIDSQYWTILVLAPVVTMGYWLEAQAATPEASIVPFYFANLGSSILLGTILLCQLRHLGIVAKPWLKASVLGAAFAQTVIIWMLVYEGIAGDIVRVVDAGDGYVVRVSGALPWLVLNANLLVMAIAAVGIATLVRARRDASLSRLPVAYVVLLAAGVIVNLAESVLDPSFSLLPYVYTAGSVAIAYHYDRERAHDIASLVSERRKVHTRQGYVAIGLNRWFLSCNEKAYEFLPELRTQRPDSVLPKGSEVGDLLYGLLDDFVRRGVETARFRAEDMVCECHISYFSLRQDGFAQGFLIDIRDATQEQHALEILSDYNQMLNREVSEKTEHIEQIQRKIVLGMANMVENRDSNTGGHVKRTSDVIQILVDEIQAQGYLRIGDDLARDIVRAAPMHDLGKISIDSNILNKPARLTSEEYEIMKTHSTTSGQMVMILLDGVEEERFVRTAYNVARYHHERWDGGGYPEGLVGEMIPLEARVMAVADVYDALVSKRVYKEPMSFEKASAIMCEGMGTQFDPNMRTVFLGCRDRLEQYYSTAE